MLSTAGRGTGIGKTEGTAQQLEAKVSVQAAQIDRQEHIILALQQQAAVAGAVPSEAEEDLKVLEAEVERLGELLAEYKARLAEAEARCRVLEREEEGAGGLTAEVAMPCGVEELQAELRRRVGEVERLREAMRAQSERSEREVLLYKAMLAKQTPGS